MRKSRVIWNVSLTIDGDAGVNLLSLLAEVLGPSAEIDRAEDFGIGIRQYGLYSYEIKEPFREISSGEIVLGCMQKAHFMGKGWHLRWPSNDKKPGQSWAFEEIEKSRLPESVNGFEGGFSDGPFARSELKGLQSASFRVYVE